ncbi:MAG TPA: hypothetical protein VLW17_11360 [Thermoanaerobaculaceae bacterium]|nr:hypothetical protein [Thermoanaerobaculaceae bacterium]
MPHVIRAGLADLAAAWRALPTGPWRWGSQVARVEGCYLAPDGRALLVAGVVVDYGRPLHPVVVVTRRGDETAVHLWGPAPVERSEGVKRFLVQVARELAAFGAGEVVTTNLQDLL